MNHGYVDICLQSHITGWAVVDGQPSSVRILVNGYEVATVPPTIDREDLGRHGYPVRSGFSYTFNEPLSAFDTVEAVFPDSSQLGNSPCQAHQTRLRELLDGIDPQSTTGIELGPLDRPILGKRGANVWYVDHASREDLLKKYLSTGSAHTFNPDRVVEVDIVWPGGPLAPRVPDGMLFDFCVAAHVIEHVPDVIGWMIHLCSVLRPGGIISLAVPDKERTFDHKRAVTTAADLIDGYIRGITRPTARHVFDHITMVSPIDRPADETPPDPTETIRQALKLAQAVEISGQYLDVHCHVFTQQSFLSVFGTLARTGLLPVKMRRFFPTREGTNEFIVQLEKADPGDPHNPASFAIA